MNASEIILSANRALLFNIIPSVRFLFLEVISNQEIKLYVYSERNLSTNEKDLYNSALGEIAGDFVEIVSANSEFITHNRPYNPHEYKGIIIYARYE